MRRRCHPVTASFLLAAFVPPSSVSAPFAYARSTVATISVGNHPWDIAYDSSRGELFVASGAWIGPPFVAGTVSIVSDATDAVVATVSVGADLPPSPSTTLRGTPLWPTGLATPSR
jgi:hypothetical protein